MNYYSTNNRSLSVSLREAVMRGLAEDNGLYMPAKIPRLPKSFIAGLSAMSNQEIAMVITKTMIGDDLPDDVIQAIVDKTITFKVPLIQLEDQVWALELFHGPTLAFKDFGAQFMAALFGHFAESQSEEITILAATSGDTGSAVAHGFHNVPGVRVIILYPSGKVSQLQEKQFTTLGGNITAIEIAGSFDDCQHLVKTAFQDKDIRQKLVLTSANSINISRLIPQSFYYFFAYAQLPKKGKTVFSVPSGNFGNLTAGVIAMKMGLPVSHFVAATNINDVVPNYLKNGKFQPKPSVQTISNAMDVGSPSNFARLLDLFDNDLKTISKVMSGFAFTDDETRDVMRKVNATTGYTLDPHGAVGYLGLKKYQSETKGTDGVFLETAHPGKFISVVEEVVDVKLLLPFQLEGLADKEKQSINMRAEFQEFKGFLLS